jgi:hypothetical protein
VQLHDAYRGIIPRVPECLSLRPNWLPPPPTIPPKRVFPPPPGTTGGGQHLLAGEGAGGANSDDWRESLALRVRILCEKDVFTVQHITGSISLLLRLGI